MPTYTDPDKRLSGSFGFVTIDGEDWADATGIEVKVEVNYEDVQLGLDVGKKMTKREGSGTIKTLRAYSRCAALMDAVQKGKSPKARLVAWLADPDADGAQEERIAIDNIKFTTLDILTFDHGSLVETEYPFTFMPKDMHRLNSIEHMGSVAVNAVRG